MQRRDVLKFMAAFSSGMTGTSLGETTEEVLAIKESDLLAVLYTKVQTTKGQRQQIEDAWQRFWEKAGRDTPPLPILVLCKSEMELTLVSKETINATS